MDWKTQSAILAVELFAGFILGRISLPFFRKIKTGKFDFYIGDRFKKDGSEPKFGGTVIFLSAAAGLFAGFSVMGEKVGLGYAFCGIFLCGVLLCVGLHEDYIKETSGGIGMKPMYKKLCEFAASAGFLIILEMLGFDAKEVLLPFRLGYIDLGWAYVPLTALFMTAIIELTQVHDCQGGVTEKGVDGLCLITTMIFALSMAVACSFSEDRQMAVLFAVCTAGSCGGLIFWSCSPSKMYLGQSGSMVLGGLICCIVLFSKMQFAYLPAGLAFISDGVCAVLERIVFAKSKKLLFKGASLHEHLKNIGWSDYKIMTAAALVSFVGAAVAIAFGVYESRLTI